MSALKLMTIISILFILIITIIISIPIDSTDMSKSNRSGMSLYIDNLTGCHYLSTLFGGLTPRMDRNGNHICTGPE